MLDARPEQRPVRARLVLVGHAHAAGVDDELVAELPSELHVRVAADDGARLDVREERRDLLLRRAFEEDVDVVPR